MNGILTSELRNSYVNAGNIIGYPNNCNALPYLHMAEQLIKSIGWGERLRYARLKASERHREQLSQGRMAALVTAELKRLGSDRTVSQSVWSEYEAEKSEPSLLVIEAAANVADIPPAYIAFASDEARLNMALESYLRSLPAVVQERAPRGVVDLIDPTRDRKLTPEEEERALRIAADQRKHEGKPRPKVAKRRAGGRG